MESSNGGEQQCGQQKRKRKQEEDAPPSSVHKEEAKEVDDDLPCPFTPVKKEARDFKEGDLLFAKFNKHPYWPAVFYKYVKGRGKKKSTHALVHFFDKATEENTTEENAKKIVLKTGLGKLKSYNCEEKDDLLKLTESNEDFKSGVEQANDYITKRALGKVSDFFCAVEENNDDEEGESYRSQNISEKDDDEQNGAEEEKLEDEETAKRKTRPVKSILFERTSKRQASLRCKELINWIQKSCRPILRAIALGLEPSSRHIIFTEGSQKEKNGLKWSSGFGPLGNKESEALLKMLVAWYNEEFPESDFTAVTYVSDVWLPEAIIRGISHSRVISMSAAELQYLQ